MLIRDDRLQTPIFYRPKHIGVVATTHVMYTFARIFVVFMYGKPISMNLSRRKVDVGRVQMRNAIDESAVHRSQCATYTHTHITLVYNTCCCGFYCFHCILTGTTIVSADVVFFSSRHFTYTLFLYFVDNNNFLNESLFLWRASFTIHISVSASNLEVLRMLLDNTKHQIAYWRRRLCAASQLQLVELVHFTMRHFFFECG